jgi:hypothetical protein
MESLAQIEPPPMKSTDIYHGTTGGFLKLQADIVKSHHEIFRQLVYEQHSSHALRFGTVRHWSIHKSLPLLT